MKRIATLVINVALMAMVTLTAAADSVVVAKRPPMAPQLVTGFYWLHVPGNDQEIRWQESRDPMLGVSTENRNLWLASAGVALRSGWTPTLLLGRLDAPDYSDSWKMRPAYRRVRDLNVQGSGADVLVGLGATYTWDLR